jgi:hypothetical protein
MQYLSSIYAVIILLHVSGLLLAHHREVTMYIRDNWYVLYALVDCWRVRLQSTKSFNMNQLLHVYIVTGW